MAVTTPILVAHILLGGIGLVLGPLAMQARKRPGLHTFAGEWYHWVMLGVCVTAGALALLSWERIGWLLGVAVGSYALALMGYVAAKVRWKGWLKFHLAGQGGSYIALCTALLVINWATLTGVSGLAAPWPWLLPTLIGSPLIAWVSREVALGRRPKR
ncbi:hypothetical protein NVV94_20665 [Pseudomonas sp. LS1212]|uniref:hypothetical protein n=1 Tax=Pseudomonas sp. LS1212 TaxID=2972478 RepID=UPI00215C28BE|nr:hypothetical protein [Pseudomonas sp. LS1212]UVJ42971.1 hypothetical protein NVV94_20665 [Pseudomonas sp. LS1212]